MRRRRRRASPGAEDWCGRLDLRGLAERVASARLLLCGDTGVAHLATALGTPSVLLFGPDRPGAVGTGAGSAACTRCSGTPDGDPAGDPHGAEVDVRLARTGVEEVLRAAERLLHQPGAPADGGPAALTRAGRPARPGRERAPAVPAQAESTSWSANHSTVRASPCCHATAGAQPSSSRARVVSGRRTCGSSTGSST